MSLNRWKQKPGISYRYMHDKGWFGVRADSSRGPEPSFKLHFFMDISELEELRDAILDELIIALENGIIQSFKYLYDSKLFEEELLTTSRKASYYRLRDFPFVIYLHDTFDEEIMKKVYILWDKIEKILASKKTGNKQYLSICDVPLSEHVYFRLAVLNGKYISAFGEKKTENLLLKKVKKTKHYLFLDNCPLSVNKKARDIITCASLEKKATNKDEIGAKIAEFLLKNSGTLPDDAFKNCFGWRKHSSYFCCFTHDKFEMEFNESAVVLPERKEQQTVMWHLS